MHDATEAETETETERKMNMTTREHDGAVKVYEPCDCPACAQGLEWWRCEHPRLLAVVLLWDRTGDGLGTLSEYRPEIQQIRRSWPGKTLVY